MRHEQRGGEDLGLELGSLGRVLVNFVKRTTELKSRLGRSDVVAKIAAHLDTRNLPLFAPVVLQYGGLVAICYPDGHSACNFCKRASIAVFK
jgi:hypothetical protein